MGITIVGAKTAYITPGSSWENRFIESFNARLRNELLGGEIFYSRVFIHLATGLSRKAGRKRCDKATLKALYMNDSS